MTPTIPSTRYLRNIPLSSNRDLPLHAQLRIALERLIDEHFENGSRFYSESQLVGNLQVSQGTVRRALAELAQRGRLEKRQARCTIVRKRAPGLMRNVSVFLPDYSSPSVARYLGFLATECLNRGINMHTIYTHQGERLLKAYDSLPFPPDESVAVLLENSPRATEELAAFLTEKAYECLVIGTVTPGSYRKFVSVDNVALMGVGLEHLVGLGHRRIALLVNEPEEKESVRERITAFEAWVAKRDLPLSSRVVHSGAHVWDDPHTAAQKAMAQAMEAPEPPTAVFAISDVGALGAIRWLQQQKFRVPDDISVMGTDGIDLGGMVHPSLTTLMPPIQEMVTAVFELLAEKEPPTRDMYFQPTLVKRESTAPPPGVRT